MKNTLTRMMLAALAVAIAFGVGPHARGDEASLALAKYDKQVDEAIDKALVYLAGQQLKDGSFQCPSEGNTGVTSLCVMAFLAKGHTPGDGPYGDVINKGLDFVLTSQRPDGMLIGNNAMGPMYSHCISVLMLSEVSGMVDKARQAKIDKALSVALKLILTAQQVKKPAGQQGGWRYEPASIDSDMSCTGWALMGLRSARNNGATVPRQAIDQAIAFIANCRTPDGAYVYQPQPDPRKNAGGTLALTGVGLLCMELCGLHKDPATVAAGDWILKNPPKTYGEGYFYYAIYYGSQGMFQLGGAYWDNWATFLYEMMLPKQQKDGSWPQGSAAEALAGTCYSTSMSVLAISVSYRQLPIYQR